MDFYSHLPAIVGILILVLVHNLWRRVRNDRHNLKGTLPPKASGALPIIGHLHLFGTTKTFARTLGEMADRHGPIFTLQLGVHRAVVVSNDEKMKECFTKNDKVLASRPESAQAKYLGYNYAAFGFAPYGAYWRDIRKIVMVELLSSHRIKSLRHVQVSEVNTMIKDLYLQCNKSNEHGPTQIVISEWLEHLSFNIITRMIAGKRCFVHEDGNDKEVNPIGKLLKEFMDVNGAIVPSDIIPFLGWVDYFKGTLKAMKRVAKKFDAMMENWIEEHKLKNNTDDKHDFIDVMLSAIEDGSKLGYPRDTIIKGTVHNIIVGATDTTAVTLTWILSNLLNNRRAMELAQEELDLKIGRERCVQESDIGTLVYIQAIIKETLRLYPPGPLAAPHEAAEDCVISGYHIPKGTRLLANLWKLHRDPKVWSNPDEFMPERFLKSQANVDVHGQHFEYLPFGTGRRSCPGINFAMQVLPLTLARLLQAFRFKTPLNEPVDMTEGFGISLPKATPLEVILTPRLRPQLY